MSGSSFRVGYLIGNVSVSNLKTIMDHRILKNILSGEWFTKKLGN